MKNNVISIIPKLKEKALDDKFDKLIERYIKAHKKCKSNEERSALIKNVLSTADAEYSLYEADKINQENQ